MAKTNKKSVLKSMVASKQSNQAKNTDPKEDKIELWPIEKVLPYPKNQKKHPDDQVEKIANSIREFGFNQPIVIEPDGTILAGHGRRLAAMKLGLTKVPVTIKKLTPPQAKAYRIADNKTNESDWDFGMLKDDFLSLREIDFDLSLTAFDQSELDKIMQPEALEGNTPPDSVGATPPKTNVEPGDIFILGNHRLMCGDSMNIQHVEQLLDGKKADACLTDPPYGIDYQSNHRKEKFAVLENDDKVLAEWAGPASAFTKGWIIFFVGWQRMQEWLEVGKQLGDLTNILIWKKSAAMGDLSGSFSPTYEMALAYNRGSKLADSKRPSAILEVNIDGATTFIHPTQKPVALFEMILNAIPGKRILDLFGGSGSVMIACERQQKTCLMMELDPKYCFVILRRWAEFTGEEPMRIDADTGELKSWHPEDFTR